MSIKLGGVGKVRVVEKYRKRGIATQMMELVMSFLHSLHVEVALFCTCQLSR